LLVPGLISSQEEDLSRLTVYYFHNTRRCATCNAIELNTLKTLNKYYKDKMETGEILFVSLNAEMEENKEICENYEVWGSTLLLVKSDAENEQVENLTDFAFAHARNNPEKFIAGLKKDIDQLIK
jgi:hypothetical protein